MAETSVSELNDTTPLIDLTSPETKRVVLQPLIPIPTATNQITLSPTNSNPFDNVARQTVSPDPFESVFNRAYSNSLKCRKENRPRSYNNEETINKENVESKNNVSNVNLTPVKSGSIPIISEMSKRLDRGEIPVNNGLVNRQIDGSPMKDKSVANITQQTLALDVNHSQVLSDFSTDEGLKAVIAKRVNKCIEKALNDTINNKIDKNKRSMSFVSLPSNNNVKNDRLNRSCTETTSHDNPFFLKKVDSNVSDSSLASCDIRFLSPPPSLEISKIEDSVFEDCGKDQVFEEANKLARTFSRIAQSFCTNTASDDEEDIQSFKPRWLYTDSSEDEEEKLRNDPALNVRVSLTNSLVQTQPDSQVLLAFKSRLRRSLDNSLSISKQDESVIKRSYSIGSKPLKAAPVIPDTAPTVPVAVIEPEGKPIKLKKKIATDPKRGPLRAVLPVQNMTKEVVPQEGKSNHIREPSPIRKIKSVGIHEVETPVKDTSRLGILPVACSTPNKSINSMPNLLMPSIEIPSNKRRSIGSTIESRKSRPALVEAGAKMRSSSANSGIPAPLAAGKPLKPLKPMVKSPLKLKSASSLNQNTSDNNQVKGLPKKKLEKKQPKPIKPSFNPRALNDIKTPSPQPGRIKTAVNTLSNFVTGKSKKLAACDKENRSPL